MPSANWMRMGILSVALLAVVAVLAVLACGPSVSPVQESGDTGNVSDNASVSATEAPFVLQQSGGGGGAGGQGEPSETPTPMATRYVPPTADRSLCRNEYDQFGGTVVGTRCPPDGHPAVQYDLRQYYNDAAEEIAALEARGETGEFPEHDVYIRTNTVEAVDEVVALLEANGAKFVMGDKSSGGNSVGLVSATMSLGLIPQLVEIDGVRWIEKHPPFGVWHGPVSEKNRRVSSALGDRYEAAFAKNEARVARGEAAVYPVVRVSIDTFRVSTVDVVVEFLKANGGKNIVLDQGVEGLKWGGNVKADISLDLVEEFVRFNGVRRVEEIKPTSSAEPRHSGGSGDGMGRSAFESSTPTSDSVVVTMQADQWHRAGFTGAGVEVAIIDSSFDGFVSRIAPLLSSPLHFLCYDADGNPSDGTLSASSLAAGGDPAGSFAACVRSSAPVGTSHGTYVSDALLSVAPDVKLYIANPDSPSARVEVLRWLTGGTGDNEPEFAEFADYNVNGNDDFDVKVINHSIGETWRGRGDGTSPFDLYTNRSLLNLAKDAVEEGVLWVNAAGNGGELAWFKRVSDSDFTVGGERLLEFSGGNTCNAFAIYAGEPYHFILRWSGRWRGASTDLNLVLRKISGSTESAASPGAIGGNFMQAGMSDHDPLEGLVIPADAVGTGLHCLRVELVGGSAPSWVQLQAITGDVLLETTTTEGSLLDPGDTAEDGVLSVGATGGVPRRVVDESARGPAPEPPSPTRVALDLVGDGSHPVSSTSGSFTSMSSPRVAGLAALVIQALGDQAQYDEPDETAQYMKRYGSTRMDCVHDWGCGFAILSPLDPPTNVTLESMPNACPIDRANPASGNVRLRFGPTTSRNPDVPTAYFVELKKVGVDDADSTVLAFGSIADSHGVRPPGGETYVAEVRTCVFGVSGEPVCGMVSAPSNTLLVPRELCKPLRFDAMRGDGLLTLRWDAQPDATGYEVARVDDDGDPVPGSVVTTTDQHLVVSGLTNGESYDFRVRSRRASDNLGAMGTDPEYIYSVWSEPMGVDPRFSYSSVLLAIDLRENLIGNRHGQFDAAFSLPFGGDGALHEVQVREAGTEAWTVLSSDLIVAGQGPRVIFTSGGDRVNAVLTGLVPGTKYEVQARSVNGAKVSPWTETETFTTLGWRPVESTARPLTPAGLRVVVVSSTKPFPRVVLRWDAATDDYLREIRVLGGGASTWQRLPVQSSVSGSPHVVRYFDDSGAFIAGLIPGTQYRFAVRAARERDSSEMLDHSPWSEVVTLKTPGVRSADAPGNAVAPALKAPSTDLMAVVSGTTATLSWTAATNPAYVEQVVRRRDLSVSPPVWTEIDVAWDATSYVDTGLASGKTYRYRVRSYKDRANDRFGEEKDGFADAVIP